MSSTHYPQSPKLLLGCLAVGREWVEERQMKIGGYESQHVYEWWLEKLWCMSQRTGQSHVQKMKVCENEDPLGGGQNVESKVEMVWTCEEEMHRCPRGVRGWLWMVNEGVKVGEEVLGEPER
ncbi:hypothetical protein H5410_009820 [Solanum commersonii]|uniref:Uncharacterized protein n=1 Tax=Solanum commersonii TaxID=4109 RepID=A0A9J6AKL3_SOLCO|nr:hypothetical protein H5410_009820 [Solanum commersonii]